jgi:hypothetical protein
MAKKKTASKKNGAADARTEVLVSLQESAKYLEQAGARVVADRLPQVAAERIALAAEDEAELSPLGFDASWRHEMLHELDAVRSKKVAYPDGHAAPAPGSDDLETTVEQANRWIARYHAVVKNSGPAVRKAAPKLAHNDHSIKVLASELERLASFVSKVAKATERHGGGNALAAEGDDLAQALTKARADHATARGAISEGAREVHAAVGAVYLELVRLSRAAHVALSKERAKVYALDELHARSRGGHAAAGAGSGTAASASGT